MKVKRIFARALLVLMAIPCLALPIMAATGYLPKYNYEQYSYKVSGPSIYSGRVSILGGKGTEYITIYENHKTDSSRSNTYQLKIDFSKVPENGAKKIYGRKVRVAKNLPSEELTATISTNVKSGFILNAGLGHYGTEVASWDEFVALYRSDPNYSGAAVKTFIGRPAFVHVSRLGAVIYLYLNEVTLPQGTGALILPIEISVSPMRETILYNYEIVSASEDGEAYFKNVANAAAPAIERAISDCASMQISSYLYRINGKEVGSAPGSDTVNTKASRTPGEVAVTVASVIAVGLLGAAAAVGAASAASAAPGGDGKAKEENQEEGSSYKMYVQKDFGNKIRRGGKHVFVYARMAEVKSDGAEVERPDLTAGIEIFTPSSHMEIGPAALAGSYMGASVKADYSETGGPAEGVVSFKFTGEGGVFQNNVTFQLVGDAEIRTEEAWLLESDTDTSAEIPFKLLDFLSPDNMAIEFTMKEQNLPFDIELDYNGGDHGRLLVRRSGSAEKLKDLMRGFMGTLTAKAQDEEVHASFVVRLCREGVYLDFDIEFGEDSEKAEIICYPGESGELPANRVGIGLAVWDEAIKRLRMIPPAELTVTCEDEKNIGEKIGLVWTSTGRTVTGRKMTDEKLSLWEVKAKKLLPYLEPVSVRLHVRGQNGNRMFEDVFDAKLMPDVSAYFDEYQKQFDHLWKLVDASFSPEFAQRYHGKLGQLHNRFGLADLQRTEMSLRKIIQYELERASIEASAVCDNYDNIIGVLEWTQWLGGICTDILLTIYTGPLGSFFVSNAKDLLVEAITVYVKKPTLNPLEIVWMAGGIAIKNTFGSLDNLSDFPTPEKWTGDEFKKYAPKLAVWVSLYYVYRVTHHYYYDLDENNQRNLYEAAKSAGWDLTVKATLELFLTEYLSKSPQSTQVFGKDASRLKDIAENDTTGFKQSRDQTIDYIKENLPKKIDEFSGVLLNYIGELKAGIQFVS